MTLAISFYDGIKYPRTAFIDRDLDFFGNGVVATSDFPVTFPSTPNMTLNVGQGRAWVDGYRVSNDSTAVLLTAQSSDPTYPRIDIIQIGHDDINSLPSLVIKKGVAQASPVEPGADPGYNKLWAINVLAGATSITNTNMIDRRSLVPLNVSGSQIVFAGSAGTNTANTFTQVQTAPEWVASNGAAPIQIPMQTVLPAVGPANTMMVFENNGVPNWYRSDGTQWVNMAPILPADLAKTDAVQTWTASQTFDANTTIANGIGFTTAAGATLASGATGETWVMKAGAAMTASFIAQNNAGATIFQAGNSTGTGNQVFTLNNTLDDGSGNATFAGGASATSLTATGLTGATAGARFVGGTTSGAPTSGTWNPADFATDKNGNAYAYAQSKSVDYDIIPASGINNGTHGVAKYTWSIQFKLNQNTTIDKLWAYTNGGTLAFVAAIYDVNMTMIVPWTNMTASTNGWVSASITPVSLLANTTYYFALSTNDSVTNTFFYVTSGTGYQTTINGTTLDTTISTLTYMSAASTYEALVTSSNASTTSTLFPMIGVSTPGTIPAGWAQIGSSASGTWTPASGSLNVAAGTVINIANVPTNATAFMVQSQGFGSSGIGSDNYGSVIGQTDSNGTTATYLWGYYGSAYAPDITRYPISNSGNIGSSAYISVGDGSYSANILIQVNNGILQGIVLSSGVSSSPKKVSWKVW